MSSWFKMMQVGFIGTLGGIFLPTNSNFSDDGRNSYVCHGFWIPLRFLQVCQRCANCICVTPHKKLKLFQVNKKNLGYRHNNSNKRIKL